MAVLVSLVLTGALLLSCQNSLSNNEVTVGDLDAGATYYFSILTDGEFKESGWSEPVSETLPEPGRFRAGEPACSHGSRIQDRRKESRTFP